jgi:hypothetical protein
MLKLGGKWKLPTKVKARPIYSPGTTNRTSVKVVKATPSIASLVNIASFLRHRTVEGYITLVKYIIAFSLYSNPHSCYYSFLEYVPTLCLLLLPVSKGLGRPHLSC